MPSFEITIDDDANPYDLHGEPGWLGAFTRQQAAGAIPNGVRVVKAREDKGGDLTPLGTHGSVVGSLARSGDPLIFYFVEWDTARKVASGCVAWKIEPVDK